MKTGAAWTAAMVKGLSVAIMGVPPGWGQTVAGQV